MTISEIFFYVQDIGYSLFKHRNKVYFKLRTVSGSQRMLRPFRPLIYKKTCFLRGKMMYFIETFRALGVARGHASGSLVVRLNSAL